MQQITPPAEAQSIQPCSPRFFLSPSAQSPSTLDSHRRIAIAVDLSDESAHAVKWAVANYLRPGDVVILLHVRPTSVLYGADWGPLSISDSMESNQKMEEDFDAFTVAKSNDVAEPLVEAAIPFKVHIVKDHDMKERLCLEVERLGLSAVIMGSRGVGASRKNSKARLGSVSDYCVRHCVCPVVVVRYPEENIAANLLDENHVDARDNLRTVPEEIEEVNAAVASGKEKGNGGT